MLLSMAIFLTLSCSSDDDSPAPDPKAKFVGTFEMDDFDMQFKIINSGVVVLDSIVALTSHPEIEFEIEDDLNEDELKTKIDEFLQTLWKRFFTAVELSTLTVDVETDEEVIAEISGDDYAMDEFTSELTLSNGGISEHFLFDSNMKGERDGEDFTLEFEVGGTVFNSVVQISGTAMGEKE